ncbi:MAG: LysM peptidoglycan-binding domain-containing protein, partial [Chromatiales bacterium]
MPYFSHKLLGVILGLLISGQVLSVAAVELNPAHPESYEVVKGDTLWDISARFLREPWLWPDVWYVNPQIANPHLIYPGDRIVLTYKDGRPILSLQRGSQHLKLSPRIRSTALDTAIPMIPIDAITPFLSRPYVMEKAEMELAPYVVHFLDDHIVGGAGTRFYVRSIESENPLRYEVIRPGKPYMDPETDELLGYEAAYIGAADLQRTGDPAKLELVSTTMESVIGDRLLPVTEGVPLNSFQPRAAEANLEGRIISVINGVSQIGQYQACRDAQDAKRDVQVPLLPSLIT